jgi:hypothetical protein
VPIIRGATLPPRNIRPQALIGKIMVMVPNLEEEEEE